MHPCTASSSRGASACWWVHRRETSGFEANSSSNEGGHKGRPYNGRPYRSAHEHHLPHRAAADLLERVHDVRVVRAPPEPVEPSLARGGAGELGDRALRIP